MSATKPTALITGANKGIGYETARQLAQQGYTVWLGCRDRDRGETAAAELSPEGDVRFVPLDVTDDDSVRAAAAHIGDTTGAVDVLVNNAGIAIGGEEGPPSTVSPDTIRRTMEVNYFGALRVIQEFLPLVRKAPAGRIVNVSSSMGSAGLRVAPGDPLAPYGMAYAYSSSKTFLNTLTGWFAAELRDTPIVVNSVCPGFNATDMNGHTGTQPPSEGAKVVVQAATMPPDGPNGTFFDAGGLVPW
ncbi:SDR family oxidoreductase [Actinoplanes sp. LDG1-06]|uniref:SDR family oxidoreductase n=1 Tax=Paractinoplanes ovalisporus TaxID=2810368 RepID=A0ABS2AHX9_9ACTN|nr:SDR family oxidoreductase [Actinoplanes ovalisporus]MBM2619437.1 SDR family oxidoreductase [Actinoplanes ovalisporus]